MNDWDFLEFTIKIYEHHLGFTNQLNKLSVGNELILHDSFGDIRYKGEGTFIAGGAGITPFIAILRQLEKVDRLGGNQLIYSNKTSKLFSLNWALKKIRLLRKWTLALRYWCKELRPPCQLF